MRTKMWLQWVADAGILDWTRWDKRGFLSFSANWCKMSYSHSYLVLTILGRAGSAVAALSWPARSIWLVPLLTGNATVDKDGIYQRTAKHTQINSYARPSLCYLPVFQGSGWWQHSLSECTLPLLWLSSPSYTAWKHSRASWYAASCPLLSWEEQGTSC